MKKILLVCAAGMSTSLLVNKMKAESEAIGEQVAIEAVAKETLGEHIDSANIVLIGPQIAYLEDDIKTEFADKNIPINVLNTVDYGMMNGKKILTEALTQI
ncbi:PTS system, cellobiose-specific IIB component [Amphibacillus marinus]|uniref:PTS system, cellobiose-specific IIB component n=1 Tax=Amphibacillus marinus TaxID=872970 RepID=A0A1H8KLZ0_9BACI|nr:PTS sugar transporter subunit IIB [Amphibacillus marinus]SEN93438.1 PTS system, cellobiose-specific IIB component [Amphibacillus marinus]